MSPGANPSANTEDLLAEHGLAYTLDWSMDDQPVWLQTTGGPLLSIPYPVELNDLPAVILRQQDAAGFCEMIVDNVEEMLVQSSEQPLAVPDRAAQLHRGTAASAPSAPRGLRHADSAGGPHLVHDAGGDLRLLLPRSAAGALVPVRGRRGGLSRRMGMPKYRTEKPNLYIVAMALDRAVVVGGSLAGLRAVETLRREGYAGALTVVGAERHPPYDRPPLSKEVLLGTGLHEVAFGVAGSHVDATWSLGDPAVGLDLYWRVVITASGAEHGYDGLVIATGCAPRRLPGLQPDGRTVFEIRTLDDALGFRECLADWERLAIVGCGFVGVEVASVARQLGVAVTVVSLDAPIAPAGALASETATSLLLEHGVELRLGRTLADEPGDGLRPPPGTRRWDGARRRRGPRCGRRRPPPRGCAEAD